jgi:hypothetical protein
MVSGAGDGTWFLYADEIFSGSAPYSDLHLIQQPLFFFVTAVVEWVSGGKFFFHRIFYFPLGILFIYSIFKISTLCSDNSILRSIIILFLFFSGSLFEAYRFDDYHVLAHSLVMLSFYYSYLYLEDKISFEKFTLIQAVLFSLTFLTRVNEGLCILLSLVFILTFKRTLWRSLFKSIVIGIFIFAAILIPLLILMHDSPGAWLSQSLLNAAASKGGDNLYKYPVKLIFNAYSFIVNSNYYELSKFLFFYNLFLLIWIMYLNRYTNFKIRIIYFAFFFCFFVYSSKVIYTPWLNLNLIPFSIIIVALTFVATFFSILLSLNGRGSLLSISPKLILIAYPFFLFVFSSLSSAGHWGSLFFPMSLTVIALIIILVRAPMRSMTSITFTIFLYFLCSFSAAEAFSLRYHKPYSWQSYYSPRFFNGFKGYQFVSDRKQGSHVMPIELRQLILPVCESVGENHTLLSLPFSFANYYCGVKPWKGYIQTFFDTTSPQTVGELINNLKNNPPDYIFYQRQLENMTAHEQIFFNDERIPFRDLDDFIMDKVLSGAWSVDYRSSQYPPSDWYLINTNSKKYK